MSDPLTKPFAYGLPTARVLDEASAYTDGVVANICGLTPADELAAATGAAALHRGGCG